MNRIATLVLLGAVLVGCATLAPGIESETKYYSVPRETMVEASKVTYADVGAKIRRLEDEEGIIWISAESATHWYRVGLHGTSGPVLTILFINEFESGAGAQKLVYDEFWAALEARF